MAVRVSTLLDSMSRRDSRVSHRGYVRVSHNHPVRRNDLMRFSTRSETNWNKIRNDRNGEPK